MMVALHINTVAAWIFVLPASAYIWLASISHLLANQPSMHIKLEI